MKTLADLQDDVRSLCFERSTDAFGLFTAAQLVSMVNAGYRKMYNEAAELSPGMFQQRSADTTITKTGYSYGGVALSAAGVHHIVRVERKNSDLSYSPLEFMELAEIGDRGQTALDSYPGAWYAEGFVIYLFQDPAPTTKIRITFVPNLTALEDAGDVPFDSNFGDFHELIAYEAALIALTKDNGPARIVARRDELLAQFKSHIARNQKQRPRRIKRTDNNDY